MKHGFHLAAACALLPFAAAGQNASTAVALRYSVSFKDAVVATQSVSIVHSGDSTTLACSFAADLPVFIATHHYSEELSVTYRPADGTVERLGARIQDGFVRTVVSGTWDSEGALRIVRSGMDGTTTNRVARDGYDFHSLVFYGRAPADFLPTHAPARVLSVAHGEVRPVQIQTIAESDTFERQYLVSTHLVWTEGTFTSHSWHPERFSNLPRRYIRQTEHGTFTFNLIR
ncbi:MAG: hypothetical protein AB7V22_00010 [Kiritimatiellia bacterium]